MNRIATIFKKPLAVGLIALIAGFGLGLLWGWVIQPVQYAAAVPAQLDPEYQREYLRMTVDSLMVNRQTDRALQRYLTLGTAARDRLAELITAATGQDRQVLTLFSQMVADWESTQPTTAPPDEGGSTALQTVIIVLGIILAVGVIGGAVFYFIRLMRGRRPGAESSPAQQAQEITRQTERTDYSSLGLAPPITQVMTTYVLGDDLYDESFSIDSPNGEFLGEYGVGVSETIGVGESKKVTALEIWLFDKNDIKTATKVLMSAHAYKDAALRQRLEAKGELVLVEPQKQIILETATLQLMATVADMEYGEGPLPPESFFERVTLELAVWPRNQ